MLVSGRPTHGDLYLRALAMTAPACERRCPRRSGASVRRGGLARSYSESVHWDGGSPVPSGSGPCPPFGSAPLGPASSAAPGRARAPCHAVCRSATGAARCVPASLVQAAYSAARLTGPLSSTGGRSVRVELADRIFERRPPRRRTRRDRPRCSCGPRGSRLMGARPRAGRCARHPAGSWEPLGGAEDRPAARETRRPSTAECAPGGRRGRSESNPS